MGYSFKIDKSVDKLLNFYISLIPAPYRNFNQYDLYAEALIISVDFNVPICNAIAKAASKLVKDNIRQNPDMKFWVNKNSMEWRNNNRNLFRKIQNKSKAKQREMLSDSYCIRCLRHKHELNYIKSHPQLIEQTRKRILDKRKRSVF